MLVSPEEVETSQSRPQDIDRAGLCDLTVARDHGNGAAYFVGYSLGSGHDQRVMHLKGPLKIGAQGQVEGRHKRELLVSGLAFIQFAFSNSRSRRLTVEQ